MSLKKYQKLLKETKDKEYGEFECPICKEVFFERKKLSGHIGGAHKRNITKSEKPTCKFCDEKLIEGKNWPNWAIKQRNLICASCKRKQNRISYRNTKNSMTLYRNKFKEMKTK